MLFVEPFILESPGEMYLRAIKIARNLRKTNKKKPYWISFNMIPLLCGINVGLGRRGLLLDTGEAWSKKLWVLE